MIIADCTNDDNGLGNRITILCSAYASAKLTGSELVVSWTPGADCQLYWHEVFDHIEGVEIVEHIPPGIRHLAHAHSNGRSKRRHIALAGDHYGTPAYWDAWRECARKIRLLPDLEIGMPVGHRAMHIRSLYPGRVGDVSLLDRCDPHVGTYLAVDGVEMFKAAMRRWPYLKFLHMPTAVTDRGICRNLDEVKHAARDMIMLTRARSIIAVGGPSTFRNLACIGFDIPVLKPYIGGCP